MADWETAPKGWETAPALLNPNLVAQGASAEGAREALRSGTAFVNQRDPGIDYKTGVKNAAFRAYLSRMDNDAEKEKFLDRTIGKGSWGKDSFGALFLKPDGLKRLGIQSEIPVSIDEQTATRYDLADVAGDAPAIVGGIGGGMAATGLGVVPGLGMAALGAAGGKAVDEIVKFSMDDQVKTPGEVATTLGKEAAMGAVGEGAARVITPIAKKLIGPGAARMTPSKKALADSAIEQGFKVRAGAVTDAPLLARWEGMVRNIFGDFYKEQNQRAAAGGLERLSAAAGARATKEAAGEAIARTIQKSRVKFSETMGARYKEIDDLVGGEAIVPTAPIKEQATALLDRLPKTADGKIIGGKDAFMNDILSMGDNMTVQQAQRLRTMLREASDSPDLVPDIAMHEARELKRAVETAFEQAKSGVGTKNTEAINKLRSVDAAYAKGISQFDRPIVKQIAKDASKGAVDPDMVVDYLIKPERLVRLRQVKQLVNPEAWGKVKSSHSQELLSSVVQGTDDPLVSIFNGRSFRDTLDKYGKEVLEEVHGKEWVDQAYKYANALMLAEKKTTLSGGIVAANIALHPMKNLPKLIWLRGVAKVMEQPGTFKYLTEGFKHGPNTDAAASAVNRLFTQAMSLARDETGSARFTVTDPELPDSPQNQQ